VNNSKVRKLYQNPDYLKLMSKPSKPSKPNPAAKPKST